MSRLRLSLFGSPRLTRDGVSLHLHSRKCMALLAYLAVTGVGHSRAALATLFRPESNARRAQGALRSALSFLKHPASPQAVKDRAGHLLGELASDLPPEVVAAATARGHARELEEVVAEILEGNVSIPAMGAEDCDVTHGTLTRTIACSVGKGTCYAY